MSKKHISPCDASSTTMSRRMTLVVALLGLPLALQTLLPGIVVSGSSLTGSLSPMNFMQEGSRSWTTQRTRDYYQALELCQTHIDAGEDVTCPGPNDLEGIQKMLDGIFQGDEDAVVLPTSDTLTVQELNDVERSLLRNYQNAGTCPESLKDFTPGFYELCKTMVTPGTRSLYKKQVDIRARQHILTYPTQSR